MSPFLSDNEVLLALQSGDNAAFDHVYSSFFKPLCFFAEKITGDAVIAQDMVSDTFVKLLLKKPFFESLENLKSYLYTSTRNSCLDHLRMEKRHQESHASIRYLSDEAQNEIEGNIVMAEVLNAIYVAIEGLPEKYRQIVKLSLVDGMNNEEIMSETGMAYQTVRNHKSEGLKLLRLAVFKNDELSSSLLIYCMLYMAVQA